MRRYNLFMLTALAAGLIASTGNAAADFEKLGLPEFTVGVCTHFGHGSGQLNANLEMIKAAGINAVRDEVSWNSCEPQKGRLAVPPHYLRYIDTAVNAGITPVNLLLYWNKFYDNGGYPRSDEAIEAYTRYCELMVSALRGKTRLHQVWNEWDGGCGMQPQFKGQGDPDAYIKLLKTVYPRLKKLDPQVVIISNSVCTGDSYLEKLLERGMLQYCDVVALHTYNYSLGSGGNTPEAWHERMVKVDQMLRKYSGGREVPLYITEMGWPTQIDPRGSTYETEAKNLARLYLLARTLPYIKGIWWYDFQDDGWDYRYNENNFGLVRPDLTPKPAYHVLQDIAPLVRTAKYVGSLDAGDANIRVLHFRLPDGKDVLAMWSSYPDDEWQIILRNDASRPEPVSVRHAGSPACTREWGYLDWLQKRGGQVDPHQLSFLLNGMPLLLAGNLSGVKIAGVTKRQFPEKLRPAAIVLKLPRFAAIATAVKAPPRPPVEAGLEQNYHSLNGKPWGGHKDLDLSFSVRYDRDFLYLTVNVTDDVFKQDCRIEDAWQGDGLQMAFQTPDGTSGHTELDAALTPAGAVVYRRCAEDGSSPGVLSDAKAVITRQGQVTSYELTIPAKTLSMKAFERGAMLGFSLLVNDNDGNGRKGFMHWGDGIGLNKDTSRYNLLLME